MPSMPQLKVRIVSAWLGERRGPDVTKALARRQPPAVEVVVPRRAEALALPLEITHASGRPLVHHEITPRTSTTETAASRLRAVIDTAAIHGDYRSAHVATGQLIDLYRGTGRLAKALDLTDQLTACTRQAGLGPGTQALDEIYRLQVLDAMGQASTVLAAVHRLRRHLDTLPSVPGPDETAPPWYVRERLLDTGVHSAILLERWHEALDLNTARIANLRDHDAPASDITRAQFNDHYPLLQLGRTDDVLTLLLYCREVFHDLRDTAMLGSTLSALADAEDTTGHGSTAIRLERDALRYTYLAGDVTAIAVSYRDLGNYLHRYTSRSDAALASHLIVGLLRTLTGADAAESVRNAALDLREFGPAADPPADVTDLCRKLGDIPDTDPAALIASLAPNPETAERTLQSLIAQAQSRRHSPR